jgi:chromosome segregation ATPase
MSNIVNNFSSRGLDALLSVCNLDKSIEQLQGQLQKAESQVEALQQKVDTLQGLLSIRENANQSVQSKLNNTLRDNSRLKEKIEKLDSLIAAQAETLEILEESRKKTQGPVAKICATLSSLMEENRIMSTRIVALERNAHLEHLAPFRFTFM